MFYTLACGSQVQYALPLVKITNSWWMVTKGLLFSAAVCHLWFERATVDKRFCIAATMRRHCCEPRRSGCAREGASFFPAPVWTLKLYAKKGKEELRETLSGCLLYYGVKLGCVQHCCHGDRSRASYEVVAQWWRSGEYCLSHIESMKWLESPPTHTYIIIIVLFFCLNKSVSLTQFLSQ